MRVQRIHHSVFLTLVSIHLLMRIKRPTNATKETYGCEYRDHECEQRDLLTRVKRPTNATKETYECVHRELQMRRKRPTNGCKSDVQMLCKTFLHYCV